MESNGLDLDQLRAFVAVADLLSFRRAADELHLSPPALSRRIERLEERVGARLLERTSRSVRPSVVGEAFLERVRTVLEDLDDAVLGVHELASGHTGRITVAAVPSAASSFVPRALARLAGRYPAIRSRLLDGSLQATAQAVLGGLADVGIGFNDSPIAGLQAELLGEDPYVLAVPAGHHWQGLRALSLQELHNEPLLSLAGGSGNRALLDEQFAQAGIAPRVIHEAAHIWALTGMVEAGLGCALVPAMVARPAPAGVAVVALRGQPLRRKITLLTPVERRLTPLAQRLLPELRAAFTT
ncbi:LysR family transcriptional regulator [Roseateles saccharophilus]|nr:LysR family transcriptional regulator [Roseateles saccharophilus]MDG0835990.1 LysR family transcriptional regulator [Roseateles saccharophilus]